MRLAVCALSAILLSGCSWLGAGGHSGGYGSAGGAYGAGCVPGQVGYSQAAYGGMDACAGGSYGVNNAYGSQGFGAGYGGQAGYGAGAYGAQGYGAGAYGAQGYGAGAYGAQGYGAGAYGAQGYGAGAYGAQALGAQGYGAGAYGAGAYGTQGVTTLGAAAPYGSAVYGQNVVGTQFANGQFAQGAAVQTVQGAPIYVPQPYPAYYGVPQLRGVGAAMPFGVEAFGGTEFGIGGDIFGSKDAGPNFPDETIATGEVSALDAVSYTDAFENGVNLGGTLAYDVSRNTTLLGTLGYSKADGKTIDNGTFTPGDYTTTPGVFTASGPAENVTGTFGDLEQVTLEGGVRQYVGANPMLRPYVGATAGFTHNNSVNFDQVSDGATALDIQQEFIDSGWRPTASGVVGAEMAVGPRAAIGVESGIRWRDNLKTVAGGAEDRWSIPLKLRGRVAF